MKQIVGSLHVVIILLGLSLIVKKSNAQDTLRMRDGSEILCKITEVGEDVVKYKEWNFLEGPDFVVTVGRIEMIRFSNGRQLTFKKEELLITGLPEEMLKKKSAIKVNFFSPLIGRTILGYEYVQKFGLHWEGEIGVIGLGKQDVLQNDERGAYLMAGPKMLLRKETYQKGERYLHFLHGSYLRPMIGFEYQEGIMRYRDYQGYPYYGYLSVDSKYSLTCFSLMLDLGKQWLLGDILVADIYFGLGMASSNINADFENLQTGFSYGSGNARAWSVLSSRGNNGEVGLAIRSGFKLGIAF